MAAGFFALLDDIALLMDDVAAISKVATKKTAGILADDLAVNAEKASGFVSTRELPVLWKITKGSFLNKIIILPIAFLLSAFLPTAIVIILLCGGVFLGYEGAEKIHAFLFHRKDKKLKQKPTELPESELMVLEKKKIKSAILIDFILSVEIIIIAIGTVIEQPIEVQIPVVSLVAFLATVGVYGVVALLVRMDDLGFKIITLSGNKTNLAKSFGIGLVKSLPIVIRVLAFVGTFAMLLVSGGIFVHNIHFIHDLFASLPSLLGEFIVGTVVGFIALLVVKLIMKLKKNK